MSISATTRPAPIDRLSSPRAARIGQVLTGVVALFLTFDATIKLFRAPEAIEGTKDLGFDEKHVVTMGVLLAAALVLHLVPRTAFLGALLVTAYLGGAVCANLRAEQPLLTHVLSPVYVAVILWAGLVLRSARLREVLRAGM